MDTLVLRVAVVVLALSLPAWMLLSLVVVLGRARYEHRRREPHARRLGTREAERLVRREPNPAHGVGEVAPRRGPRPTRASAPSGGATPHSAGACRSGSANRDRRDTRTVCATSYDSYSLRRSTSSSTARSSSGRVSRGRGGSHAATRTGTSSSATCVRRLEADGSRPGEAQRHPSDVTPGPRSRNVFRPCYRACRGNGLSGHDQGIVTLPQQREHARCAHVMQISLQWEGPLWRAFRFAAPPPGSVTDLRLYPLDAAPTVRLPTGEDDYA